MNEYVFISYKSEQKDVALKIKNILEKNNIPCWMAPESISGGLDYAAEITRAISSCKEFVVILSSLSQDSKYVLKEIDSAIKRNKNVLPFVIDNFNFNDSIDYYLTNVQLYTAYLSWESALEKLIREIRYSFESIDAKRAPYTILNDPIKISSSLPHSFDSGYLLFGRYQIQKLLRVYPGDQQHYLGLDLHTSKSVLIKYVDRTVPHQECFGISTNGTLFQHPYIASAIDEYSNESYFINIEPFYEVDSLNMLIEQSGPQTEKDVLKWSIAVCQAMMHLNEDLGYVYGQMTPQNIRIQKNGLPILFDMGIAVPLGSSVSNSSIMVSSHHYVIPLTYEKILTPTIDIFALGENMYYALTGESYFEQTFLSKDFNIIDDHDSISYGFKLILKKCLQLQPKDRYQSFKELMYDLENIDDFKKEKTSLFKRIFKIR